MNSFYGIAMRAIANRTIFLVSIIFSDDQTVYIVIGVIILVVIIAGIAKASQLKSDSYKDVEKAHFTPKTKEIVKDAQKGKMCNM